MAENEHKSIVMKLTSEIGRLNLVNETLQRNVIEAETKKTNFQKSVQALLLNGMDPNDAQLLLAPYQQPVKVEAFEQKTSGKKTQPVFVQPPLQSKDHLWKKVTD